MIQKLSQKVIEKIAAGEVVERPASVVKELVENAIDANATMITVTLEKAGKERITVQDNGEGMSKEDLLLAVKRHTTSKIKDVADITNIQTLGFRGEALASICAVSDYTITTKKKGTTNGYQLNVEDSQVQINEVATNEGTVIDVKELFVHIPARKKFLKTDAVELGHIVTLLSHFCLAHPSIGFELIHNQKTLIQSPAVQSLQEKISHIYGLTLAKETLKVAYNEDIAITGRIVRPTQTRTDKTGITFYLNGRFIKNSSLTQAVIEGYETLLMIGRYPYGVLHLTIDPQTVDVNVHPSKNIVKFDDEPKILQHITAAVKQSLQETVLIKDAVNVKANVPPQKEIKQTYQKHVQTQVVQEQSQAYEPQVQQVLEKTPEIVDEDLELTYKDIVQKTYIVCDSPQGIVLIDFHAAHERYLYEEFSTQYKNNVIETQELLSPEIVELSPQDFTNVLEQQSFLSSLGLEIDAFGENTVAVRKIPILIKRQLSTDLLKDILTSVSNQKILDEWQDHVLATMGCRAAYKAGDNISSELAKKLVRWLMTSEQKYACPHGRPIFVRISTYELEKLFKRKV